MYAVRLCRLLRANDALVLWGLTAVVICRGAAGYSQSGYTTSGYSYSEAATGADTRDQEHDQVRVTSL